MIRKSDKKLKDRTKEDKIAKNEGFDEFFNQVLKNMPARSAKIIKSSFVVSKAKAEQFLANNSQKFDQLFDEFLVGVDSQTRRKCHETIHFATLTAAIVGFSPIPFSDAVLLVPIQLTMMMRLYKNQCMIRHVISAFSVMRSVYDQTRDECMISHVISE